jgi:hypothetical protein
MDVVRRTSEGHPTNAGRLTSGAHLISEEHRISAARPINEEHRISAGRPTSASPYRISFTPSGAAIARRIQSR